MHANALRARDPATPAFAPVGDASDCLSPRELEIVRLACLGLTNREIARGLEISPQTGSTHLRHAYAKLGVSRRAALAGSLVVKPS